MLSDLPPSTPARKVNIRRGMFRAWLLFSVLWALPFLGLSASIWYYAASYWYHTRGIQVTEDKNGKTLTSGKGWNAPLIDNPKCHQNNRKCLSVISPKGCRYFMIIDRRVYTHSMAAAYVAEREETSTCARPTSGGLGNGPILIDLTASDGGTGWVPLPHLGYYPDTATAELFTIMAFAVPGGLLALGAAIGWVARGFKL